MVCLGNVISGYRGNIKLKSDEVLMRNAMGVSDDGQMFWYDSARPEYRLYMRLVKQEIHRRGLKDPSLGT